MDNSDRPTLKLDFEYAIEQAQQQIDALYWSQLQQMQRPTPAKERSLQLVYPTLIVVPPVPPSPMKLRLILSNYANDLFNAEAGCYPNDARLLRWLKKLEERCIARVFDTVARVEKTGKEQDVTIAHHGLRLEQMREAMSTGLAERIKDRLVKAAGDDIKARLRTAPQDTEQGSSLKTTPKDAIVQKRKTFVEAILTEKGWSILDWANEANVAYHTAADYLAGTKKPYRSTRVKLAKALGIPPNQLPE